MRDDLNCYLAYPWPMSLDETRAVFRINKTFIRGASPGIPYELWDKTSYAGGDGILLLRNGNSVTEVEIATFVVKEIPQLAVPPDR